MNAAIRLVPTLLALGLAGVAGAWPFVAPAAAQTMDGSRDPAGAGTGIGDPVWVHPLELDPARPITRGLDPDGIGEAVRTASSLPRLRCLLVARHGEMLLEHCREGSAPDRYANVKSVSKSVLSALVGAAIEEGHLRGPDQPVVPLLAEYLDAEQAEARAGITIGHLLSMQSGLERTSGRNYGGWVSSRDWVRNAIRRPVVAEPGGRMLYSTGNYHLLAAVLTRATGEDLLRFSRRVLGEPLGVSIPAWLADPQGIYFGGNEMRLTPRAMVAFGELYRNEGRVGDRQVLPGEWVRSSLLPRTRSPWSGERYGYGWFLGDAGGFRMFFAWGYGGQYIFVVPDLALTVVTTSDADAPRGGGHLRAVHDLLDRVIVPAAVRGAPRS